MLRLPLPLLLSLHNKLNCSRLIVMIPLLYLQHNLHLNIGLRSHFLLVQLSDLEVTLVLQEQ